MKKILFILLLFVVSLWGIIFFAPQLLQPGAMATGHQDLGDDCFACHTAFAGPSRRKCLVCHDLKQIDNNVQQRQALHSKLLQPDCTACHTNHLGRYSRDRAHSFSHDLMAPSTLKKCTDCHAQPETASHVKSDANCGQCHKTGAWRPASFAHERYFRLDDEHDVSCNTCHPDEDFGQYTCFGCHEHSSGKLAEEHREEGIQDFQNCARCHPSGDEDEARHGQGLNKRYQNGHDSREEYDDEHTKRPDHKNDHDHDD
ncbi:MAG: multiheme c-type cytochrome [Desulfovermiculus sp.]|nr:multiheme c-type cytochrome [Desulfovermiculus sp.]